MNNCCHCCCCSKRLYYPCPIEEGCEWYYGRDGLRKHMKYHDKKKVCDINDHQWIVKADSADIKFYECEWCDAELRQPKF